MPEWLNIFIDSTASWASFVYHWQEDGQQLFTFRSRPGLNHSVQPTNLECLPACLHFTSTTLVCLRHGRVWGLKSGRATSIHNHLYNYLEGLLFSQWIGGTAITKSDITAYVQSWINVSTVNFPGSWLEHQRSLFSLSSVSCYCVGWLCCDYPSFIFTSKGQKKKNIYNKWVCSVS